MLVDRLGAGIVLCVSPGTVDNLRKRGQLPSLKINARRLYDLADLRLFIDSRKGTTTAPVASGDKLAPIGGGL